MNKLVVLLLFATGGLFGQAAPRWTGDAAKIGMCAFHWTRLDAMAQVPHVRIWWDLSYSLTRDGIAVNPLHGGSKPTTERADDWLRDLRDSGVTTVLCLENWPYWDRGGGDRKWNDEGGDPTRPESYSIAGRYTANLAFRYGLPSYNFGFVPWVNTAPRWNNDPPNEARQGLNVIDGLEIENEANRWWRAPNERYTPVEYAALLLRCYADSKAVDPALPVIMGGLSEPNVTYLAGMKAWFDARGTAWPSDAVNVHYYANEGNKDIPGDEKLNLTKIGCAPELDDFAGRMARVVAFAKSVGKPVWLSEAGYDTDPISVQRAPAFGPYTSEEVAGIWIQRTILEGLRVGVERFYVYNSIDEPSWNPNDPNTGGLYRSVGLLTCEKCGQQPKAAFVLLGRLISQLNGFVLTKDESRNGIRILRFSGPGNAEKYVYWLPVARTGSKTFLLKGKLLTATERPKFYLTKKGRTLAAKPGPAVKVNYSKPKTR